jgi:hypothetical protein
VRHATEHDLDQLDDLLAELRAVPELRERKRGYFSLRSTAFLHFHEDSGDFYVDVKLDGALQRMRVTTRTDQLDFLRRVRQEATLAASSTSSTSRR